MPSVDLGVVLVYLGVDSAVSSVKGDQAFKFSALDQKLSGISLSRM